MTYATRLDLFGGLRDGAICIEVGTFVGEFAVQVKMAHPRINLACVDDWAPPFFDKYRPEAYARLAGHANILEGKSVDIANGMPRECADLIYIDGAHDKESVAADLEAWWPVLKRGGLFAGHDYFMRYAIENWGPVEVPLAVDPWAEKHGLTIQTTTDDQPPSWWTRKP